MIDFLFKLLEEEYFEHYQVIEIDVIEITDDYLSLNARIASKLNIKYNIWKKEKIIIKEHIILIREYKLNQLLNEL